MSTGLRQSTLVYSVLVGLMVVVPAGAVRAGVCACDADVNNNGVVNVIDWACIQDCKAGSCGCCVDSCDVNCDGVVNDMDAGDSINDPSMWQCQFIGFPASVCCGSCCNETSGVCADDVVSNHCDAGDEAWSQGLRCSEIACDPLPTGACCDLDFGTCQNGLTQALCTGANLVWSNGMSCAQVSCPAPPVGACCNQANGHCHDAFLEVNCSGAGFVWTEASACTSVSCSTPPQDPCLCDGDVNGAAPLNVIDVLAVLDCAEDNCSNCVDSCDVNCDGYVDHVDTGIVTCQFYGLSDCCNKPSGACVNPEQVLPPCSTTSEQACDLFGGTYRGHGTYCVDGVVVPTMSAWGLLAMVLLTLAAATTLISRRRDIESA